MRDNFVFSGMPEDYREDTEAVPQEFQLWDSIQTSPQDGEMEPVRRTP